MLLGGGGRRASRARAPPEVGGGGSSSRGHTMGKYVTVDRDGPNAHLGGDSRADPAIKDVVEPAGPGLRLVDEGPQISLDRTTRIHGSGPHKLASKPKGITAGDLLRGFEGSAFGPHQWWPEWLEEEDQESLWTFQWRSRAPKPAGGGMNRANSVGSGAGGSTRMAGVDLPWYRMLSPPPPHSESPHPPSSQSDAENSLLWAASLICPPFHTP